MFTISLAYYKNLSNGKKVRIPYWFTRDGKIHLNTTEHTRKLNETILSRDALIQIYNAVVEGTLTIDNLEKVQDSIKTATNESTKSEEEIVNTTQELAEKKKKEKIKSLRKKAEELLSGGYNTINKKIGYTSLNDDGSLKDGISDVELLVMAIDIEKEKEEPRNTVIKLIERRLAAISNSNGILKSEEEESIELTPEDFKE